jgi:hypothetical protein
MLEKTRTVIDATKLYRKKTTAQIIFNEPQTRQGDAYHKCNFESENE